MINEPVKMLRTLKVGHGATQKIWLEGEIIYPPLPIEIQQEVRTNSKTCVLLGKEPKPSFNRQVVKHFVPDMPEVDPVLDGIREKTKELVKKEQVVVAPPSEKKITTGTTQGQAVHASAPTFKRRTL